MVPTIGGVYHYCLGVLTRLVREPGGGVTILKNPYKTKSYKGRKLFFSVEGTYHRGSMPLMFLGVLTRLVREPGGGGGSRF